MSPPLFLRHIFLQIMFLSFFIPFSFSGKDDPIITYHNCNNLNILKDYITTQEILCNNKKLNDITIEEIKELDEKDFFEISSLPYPVIIQNKSAFLVVIVSRCGLDFSSPRFIAPHETIIEYIDHTRNFKMYRLNPASSIVNVAGIFTATSTFTTIAASTFFIYSAPLSFPVLANAFICGGASFKMYKWITSIQNRFPIANTEIDPGLINIESIAKITIINSDDETSINSILKIENAKNLILKYSAAFTEKINQLKNSNRSLKFSGLIKPFERQYKVIFLLLNDDPEFNHKAAKLFALYHQMLNTLTPPEQTSAMNKLINWVTNSENHEAIMNVVKTIN
jgi:hypothetical protein